MSFYPPPRAIRFHKRPSPLRLASVVQVHDGSDEEQSDAGSTLDMDEHHKRRPSLHRTSRPLPSILKRKKQIEIEDQEDVINSGKEPANRFEISVIRYRTSCCKALVCVEHISDWIHGTPSDSHRCPSCMLPCALNAPEIHSPAQSFPFISAPVSLSPKSEKLLSLARTLLQQQYAKITSQPPITTPTSQVESIYTLFDTDDEPYPETEHTCGLASSRFVTDIMEVFVRLASIAGLTMVLLALLS